MKMSRQRGKTPRFYSTHQVEMFPGSKSFYSLGCKILLNRENGLNAFMYLYVYFLLRQTLPLYSSVTMFEGTV
jgi:hypothetical protein